MAYKVLYRKYRPNNFNELYGQENIKNLLQESIIKNKISHAYLFSGPRGTGKTSTAKLFAKSINCINAKDGIPCEECESCINYEQNPDIIEIDAASNNGVDEIRDLRENCKILPTFCKYKVYIIDEVHMLSQSAWNAFLKTLEEPPKHVIFILATTEINKIPITILSRCQRFRFQKISSEIIVENILRISRLENINLDKETAEYIAELSDGGMRDALSILDQLSKDNNNISKEQVYKTFGMIDYQLIINIFESIKTQNINEINNIFEELEITGIDLNTFINKLLKYLYNLELKIISNEENFINLENLKHMSKELAECTNKKEGLQLIKIILLSYFNQKDVKKIISREIILDKKEEQKIENNTRNSEKAEEKAEENVKEENVKNNTALKEIEINEDLINVRINNSFVNADKKLKEEFISDWEKFISKLVNNVELLSLIEDVDIAVVSNTNVLFTNLSSSSALLFNSNIDEIEKEFKNTTKKSLKFICITKERWKTEKNKYISDNGKETYKYIDEVKITKTNKKSVSSAEDIFETDIIEIN